MKLKINNTNVTIHIKSLIIFIINILYFVKNSFYKFLFLVNTKKSRLYYKTKQTLILTKMITFPTFEN